MKMNDYDVLDVSRYVINYSNKKKYGISNLKLQKVLYFIQVYFLINTANGKRCFHEKIEAWDFDPVVPKVYREYKRYGSTNIPTMESYLDSDNMISEEDSKRIDIVVDVFSDFSATDLVTLTHNHDPWKDAYVPHMDNEITVDSIRKYFNE